MDNEREHIDDLAAELALGTISGNERAAALDHVAHCEHCRQLVLELSQIADHLLELAPESQPPVGFESRVLDRLQAGRPTRRRLFAMATAAALVAGLLGGGAVLWATRDDRAIAARYRDTLAVADGKYFAAFDLYGPAQTDAGHVFAYEGEPSWVYVVFDNEEPGIYECSVVTTAGERITVAEFEMHPGQRGWGVILPVGVHDVAEFRMESGTETLAAKFAHE